MELDCCIVEFLDHDVVHAHFKDGLTVDVPDVRTLLDAITGERRGRKALLMVSMGVGTRLTNEARAFASSEESCAYIAADAIIVRDFEHQLAANVFVRHHRPHRPIRMFGDRESAIAWLKEHHHLIDSTDTNA